MSNAEKNPVAQHPEFQQSLQRNLQSATKTAAVRLELPSPSSLSAPIQDRAKADMVRRTSTADSAPLVEDVDHIDLGAEASPRFLRCMCYLHQPAEEHGIHGIKYDAVLRNPSVPKLYEYALKYEKGSKISSSGALMCRSGDKTVRARTFFARADSDRSGPLA